MASRMEILIIGLVTGERRRSSWGMTRFLLADRHPRPMGLMMAFQQLLGQKDFVAARSNLKEIRT
jgi:hypothetical protein